MMRRGQDESKVVRLDGSTAGESESLPYSIELWDGPRKAIERELARASSAELGRAIFKAARTEHPGRRITLRRGKRMIWDSAR
jgi:hypothetical protein